MFTFNLCCGALVKFGDVFIGKSSYFVKTLYSLGGYLSVVRRSSGGQQVFIRLSSGDYQKSDNLQYNTLGRWVDGTNNSSTKRLMFQALFFFIISYRLRAPKTLYFYFCKVIKK